MTITEIVAVEEFSQMLVPRGLAEKKLGRKEETQCGTKIKRYIDMCMYILIYVITLYALHIN